MPNRMIKDSIHDSEKVNAMTDFQFRLWINLITYVDDFGRGDARPAVIRGQCFPLRERLTNKDIEAALEALAGIGCVSLYEVDGRPYLYFPTWESHQTIRNQKSKFPAPESNCEQLKTIESKCSRNPIQSEFESESESESEVYARKRAASPAQRFSPPTVDEVKAYCTERGNKIDAQHFVDFYASKGWKVGNQPMKDWKACVRTWEQRDSERGGYVGTGASARPNPALQYSQRQYTQEDDDALMKRFNDELLRDAGE